MYGHWIARDSKAGVVCPGMISMKRQLLLLVPVIECLMVLSGGSDAGINYYVKPSHWNSSQCPGQPCETFLYYLENVHTTLNQENNVTMIFLNGEHNVKSSKYFKITTPIIRMIGESEESNVQILHQKPGILGFSNNAMIIFKNLTLIEWFITMDYLKTEFLMSSVVLLQCDIDVSLQRQAAIRVENSVTYGWELWSFWAYESESVLNLSNCTFYSMSISIGSFAGKVTARVMDCTFIKSPLSIQRGNLILSGATVFRDTAYNSAVVSYEGSIVLSDTALFINNFALRGGAMALYSSTLNIAPNAVVTFVNNSAVQLGGAIYITPGVVPIMVLDDYYPYCAYKLLNCSTNSTYKFIFEGNSASNGGHDIYGISLIQSELYNSCYDVTSCNLTINGASSSNSSISSDPFRVCMCDHNGEPQCKKKSYVLSSYNIHPGEEFTLSVVVVGGDFGLTTGTVYNHVKANESTFLRPDYGQEVRSISSCTKVKYTLYSQSINSFVGVYFTAFVSENSRLNFYDDECHKDDLCLLEASVFVNFTILPCPPGFILLDNPPRCDCYSVLRENLNVTCHITKGTGHFSWVSDLWMNVQENETIYDEYCPLNYCKKSTKQIDIQKSSNSQCDFNRAGRLCGKCDEGYSLAIGSSNCIICQNNNNLALIIFFAAAGFLLVFFIGALNITVTQGTINGLIFYANIVWTYKDIFFPQVGNKNAVMIFLKTFIAWLNLDFGIETCFVKGLTGFWKTWLQYVFPFYIWTIAGLIIAAARHSTRLTNLLCNRAVPLLATLFLISYIKLLRVVVSSLEFSILFRINYVHGSESLSRLVVWSVDGSLGYFAFPHILLVLAGLATLLFLWMPYTLLLLSMQWIRRLPQRGLLKWVMRFNPLYDAYFAPLKDKHHYWFGAHLLARGILLVVFASSFAIPQDINLLLLLILSVFFVYYMVLNRPYKSSGILILQSSYLINLILLSGCFFFSYRQPNGPLLQSITVGLSTGFVFLQFCGIVIHAVIAPWCCKGLKQRLYEADNERNIRVGGGVEQQIVGDAHSVNGYRDSIFNESVPLLPTY